MTVPTDCWYAITPSSAVNHDLLALRAAARAVVLFRTTSGEVVALEDRCAHRPYPLSAGTLDGDLVRCGLCGFTYASDGQCVAVPTQPRVPLRASVPAFPVREVDGLVWVWLGEPGRARLHRIPELPWLDDPAWASVGDELEVAASFLLLHESFADVTKVPFIAPDLSPHVLEGAPPPLEVVVTETTVSLSRTFPRGPLPAWQADLVGRPDAEFDHRQEGFFMSPAAWVDHWDVQSADGAWHRLRFTQLVTPIDATSSRLMWRVSRDFAVSDAGATARMAEVFGSYYPRVTAALEAMQRVIDVDGSGPEVNVSSDAAALKVRQIVADMLSEEGS
jgi:vanillate O-demethylase monooxygenase subunit